MKSLIQIFLLNLLTFSLLAQADSLQVDSTQVEEEVAPSWEKSFGLGLSLSHTLNINAPANSASKEGFGSTVSIDAVLNYIKEKSRFTMRNDLSCTKPMGKYQPKIPLIFF